MHIYSKSPAKIIISGEHAVVYGAPAIAIPANCYAMSKIKTTTNSKEIAFDLPDLNYQTTSFSKESKNIFTLYNSIQSKYASFLHDQCAISEVLNEQAEIFPFALVKFAQYLAGKLNISFDSILAEFYGTEINIKTDIPLYCGMGSSAATIVSFLKAFLEFCYQKKILALNEKEYIKSNYQECFAIAREVENLQHGHSSGLDIAISMNETPIYFSAKKIYPRKFLNFPKELINTGRPESNTGECVMSVAKYFQDAKLLADFAAITNAIDKILQATNLELGNLKYYIRQNHKLLCRIGVVPDKVKTLIADLEQRGLAAKISGAGAVRGENAGIVLVIGHEQ